MRARSTVTRLTAALLATVVVAGCSPSRVVEPSPPGALRQQTDQHTSSLPGRLGFVDATADEVADAIRPYGGEVVIAPEGLRLVEAAFPVDDEDQLLAIRDELRSQGFRTDLVPTTDPGVDSDEFVDVEP